MIVRLSLAIAALLFGTSLNAQGLRVLSGEHPTFTRLAVVFPDAIQWTAGRMATGYLVDLGPDSPALDFDRIFARIPRTRIQDVTYSSITGQLKIASDCECYINVFESPKRTLVIDVRSGAAPANSRFEALLEAEPNRMLAGPVQPSINLLQRTLAPKTVEPPKPLPTARDTSQTLLESNLKIGTVSQRTLSLEQALIESLGRAGSQGLVDLAIPQEQAGRPNPKETRTNHSASPMPQNQHGQVASDDPAQKPEHAEHQMTAATGTTNIRSQTSFDRELNVPIPEKIAPDGKACYSPTSLHIAEWGMEKKPEELLSSLHSLLVSDGNSIDAKVLRTVARGYLYLGFGAEAKSFIEQTDKNSWQNDLIRAMANVLDDTGIADERAFENMLDCPNASAMWSLLEEPQVSKATQLDATAIRRAFLDLPVHLRTLIGPRLSSRLTEANQPEAARAILDSLRRTPGTLSGAAKLVEAHDEIAHGQVEVAAETFEEIATENSESSPDALINLLELNLKRETAAPEELVELAQAMITEIDGTELADRLRTVVTRTLAQNSRFDEAFAMAKGERGQKNLLADVQDELVSRVTAQTPDGMFLALAFREVLPVAIQQYRPETLSKLATRLLDLGFAEEANQVSTDLAPDGTTDTRVLLARIQLEMAEPRRALELIAGQTDQASQTIRARAMAAINIQADAAASFAEAGDSAAAAQAAWLSGERNPIATFGSPQQGNFLATLEPGETFNPEANTTSLNEQMARTLTTMNAERATRAQGRQLVGQSEAFRSAAQDLLQSQ